LTCSKRASKVLVFALLCAAISGLPSSARANDTHYQDYLIGERAVGFGGAFAAIADDSSAVFYNPAGLSQLDYSSVNLSAAIYGFSSSSVDIASEALVGNGAQNDNSTFVTYPTSAVWIYRLRKGDKEGVGRIQGAFSLLTPFSSIRRDRFTFTSKPAPTDGGGFVRGTSLTTQLVEDDTLWAGISIAYRPIRWLHIGLSLFGTMRSALYQFYDLAAVEQLDALGVVSEGYGGGNRVNATLKHYGLVGMLGVLVQLTEGLKLAATFRTPQLSIANSVKLNIFALSVPDNGVAEVQSIDLDGKARDKHPFKVGLALAYSRPRRFSISVDFNLYGPLELYPFIELEGQGPDGQLLPIKRKMIWQLNVGGEVYLTRQIPVRLGFFTNLSAYDGPRDCDPTDETCQARIDNPLVDATDRFGIAAAVGYEIDRATITLGMSFNFGTSDRKLGVATIETSRSLLFLVLGGSFRF
jgi:hypothetical protein